MSNKIENNYGADQIQVLEGLEAVRKRPGMYIGSTTARGLHHLIWEIVDNSVDEYIAGYGNKIQLVIHQDNSISVTDEGRGLPVDMHKKMNKPAAEVILTVLHAGGKFGGGGYKVSGGLHGVGSSVVNALSSEMKATIKRNGKIYEIGFEKGITTIPLHEIGTCDPNETGTKIWFKPDETIFKETTEYDFKRIFDRLREVAFLNRNLHIKIVDERVIDDETDKYLTKELCYEKGIVEYVGFINSNKKVYHKDIFYMKDTFENVEVEVALQYHDGDSKDGIYSFANNIHTHEGGTHETGFKTSLTNVVKSYIDEHNLMKGKKEKPNGDDTRVGLTAIVSVKVVDPEFEGQTKTKLGSSEAQTAVNNLFSHHFSNFLTLNPNTANIIISRIIQSCELRLRMKQARENEKKKMKNKHLAMSGTSKLAPAQSKDATKTELYLVEGDSAGGSAKSGRDRQFQAILPLRGKVLNTEKTDILKVTDNNEINDIANSIGTGLGDDFEYEKLKYSKIILMTDADVDGEHINVLLLTFFYRYMRPLIEKGHVYLALPPLYQIKSGKKLEYVYSDAELKEALETRYADSNPNIQRYKGLGEMNAEQLWDTTMNPETRTLVQIEIDDIAQTEILFTDLMGSDVTPRKEFIENNAMFAVLDL